MRYYYGGWLMERTGLILILVLIASSGWGQTLTGTIQGTVTDPDGAVVPGVDITLVNTGTNQTRTVAANGSGNYSAPGLPVGTYDLRSIHRGIQHRTTYGNRLTDRPERTIRYHVAGWRNQPGR